MKIIFLTEFSVRILNDEEHVAVLFYEEKKRDSMKALQHLELIDDEADLFGIRYQDILGHFWGLG